MNARTDALVVDVGNSCCKIGRVEGDRVVAAMNTWLRQGMPWDDPDMLGLLQPFLKLGVSWALSGSNPPVMEAFAAWLISQSQTVHVIDASVPLPIRVALPHPENVGRDRLLNALAVTELPAVIISAGTAVTVDVVSKDGAFLGGAIFPGLDIMAEALHLHTAKLPRVEVTFPRPKLPATNTVDAMNSGIIHAVVGGILGCHGEMVGSLGERASVYLTGGSARDLREYLPFPTLYDKLLTLQGILNAARTLWP